MRLAEEYDAAQERGEVVGAHDGAKKRVGDHNAIATAADLGLRRDEIHEARKLRDAWLNGNLPFRSSRTSAAPPCGLPPTRTNSQKPASPVRPAPFVASTPCGGGF